MTYLLSIYNQVRTQIESLDSSPISLYYNINDFTLGTFIYLIYMIYEGTILILVLEYREIKEKIIILKKCTFQVKI